jgi:hypothetical protein
LRSTANEAKDEDNLYCNKYQAHLHPVWLQVIHYCQPPASTTVGDPEAVSRERNTDLAVNILYVLGLISVGDGCSEAGRLLGLLGLSNHTTMEGRSFNAIIEESIRPYIEELTNEILHKNLEAEVKATVSDSSDLYLPMATSASRYCCP